ncbi:MAG: Eco57I restriction-modification methylase domain-containing protein [Thermoleophilaceae bacterium]
MTGAEQQLELALGPFRNQRLFAEHFLADRLPEWPDFARLDAAELFNRLRDLWRDEAPGLEGANEAQTEERWIQPVLQALGFAYTVQAGVPVGLNRRQPDYALFLSDIDRLTGDSLEGVARYERAAGVADAKRFDRPLDRRAAVGAPSEDPVAQIINYLSITRRPWGILTNGRLWRLYSAEADLISGACYEVDLVGLLEAGDAQAFRYFAAFFASAAFAPDAHGRSFLDRALSESQANAVQVGVALERQVFSAVPLIAEGLLADEPRDETTLAAAFDNALVLLYRLLFCLHAEARELLPVENPHYREYSLRQQKGELARDRDRGRVFSSASDDLYNDLRALFRIVDKGDPALGVGEYNGGLFSTTRHPYFADRSVPDDRLAPALDYLYRVAGEFVDYRDLSVRHLGTIYERLLDYRLEDRDGTLVLVPASGRRETGSYFTPEYIVDRIVERTLEPVLERRSADLARTGTRGQGALETFLEIRVLDPAMGSGHFLVAAAGFIAQYAATDPSYDGDLPLSEIQRLVAERCIYGVDANPMAVELAQLSLWLTTVQRDEPLTFLHNLRVGNSLVGADLTELVSDRETVFAERLARNVEGILQRIGEIAHRESRAGAEVREKERLAATAEELRRPLEEYADAQVAPGFSNGVGRFFHWDLEFPEVFLGLGGRRRSDGGFDAVVGNPPYIRIQALGRELAAYCRRHYRTASGSFDTYVPFIERSLSLLRADGRLGFIVPNKLLKLDYAQRLRERLASGRLIEEIIDFGDAQIFAGATNYTCVLLLDRGGHAAFEYRRVSGSAETVRRTLVNVDTVPGETFAVNRLGGDPWVLATGEEARILEAARSGAERLDTVTTQIFQGLITSADPVYILEDRGGRGMNRAVYSRALGEELELEPDLLHPLASGVDVERYAFRPLGNFLLFPYRRDRGQMRLLTPDELAALPLTAAYLDRHETELRARERGRMDRDGWYAFGRTQSLGAHDSPKLGVAATVKHLEVAADPDGAVYFHNVRVNGILIDPKGPSIWTLLVLLNSRLVDWIFRRGAAEHANGYYAANKQFIAPLPIRLPAATERDRFEQLGQELHRQSKELTEERRGFLGWLSQAIGARPAELQGSTVVTTYDEHSAAKLLAILKRNQTQLTRDVSSRAFGEELARELEPSIDRIRALRRSIAADETAADDSVFELYGLTAAQRALIEAETLPDEERSNRRDA